MPAFACAATTANSAARPAPARTLALAPKRCYAPPSPPLYRRSRPAPLAPPRSYHRARAADSSSAATRSYAWDYSGCGDPQAPPLEGTPGIDLTVGPASGEAFFDIDTTGKAGDISCSVTLTVTDNGGAGDSTASAPVTIT